METVRIVLTEPFVKHPAGLVFELNAETGVSGWDDDDRVRERMNYSGKRCYLLPDGGNGLPYELPLSLTRACPDNVFENIDLRSGPVRITASVCAENGSTDWENTNLKYELELSEISGNTAQGIGLPEARLGVEIRDLTIQDMLRNSPAYSRQLKSEVINLEDLYPGFYQLNIRMSNGSAYRLSLVKSFPLLVLFSGNSGQYSVQKTLY